MKGSDMPGNAQSSRRNFFTFGIGATLLFSSVSLFGQSASPPQQAVVGGSSSLRLQAASGVGAVRGYLAQGGVQSTDDAGTNVVGAPYSAVGTREDVTRLLDGNRLVT